MKYFVLVLGALLLFTGCVTTGELVQKIYKPTKGGVVRYSLGGKSESIQQRYDQSLKKAEQFCGGPIDIIQENSSGEFAGTVAMSNGVTAAVNRNFSYIRFDCKN